MKDKILGKGLVLAIVVLFISTGVYPAIAIKTKTSLVNNQYMKDNISEKDGQDNKFITTMDNHPPYEPGTPHPTDGSIKVPTYVVLRWTGGDPDPGDNVTYDVYFGDSLPINNLVSNNQSENCYELTELELNKTYFWRIVAWDNNGESTSGPNWSFTTGINLPPSAPKIRGPHGKPRVKNSLFAKPLPKTLPKPGTYNYTFNATDPENEDVYYYIEWGDGTCSGWIGPFLSGEEITCNHTWTYKGKYMIKAKAKDIYDQEGPWGEQSIPIKHMSKFVIILQFIKILKQILKSI